MEVLAARLLRLLAPPTGGGWAIPIIAGRSEDQGFELHRRGKARVVVLHGTLEGTDGGTLIRLETRTVWRTALPALLVVLANFAALLTFAFLLSRTQVPDFALNVLVPLLAVMTTGVVIFVPAMAFMILRYRTPQARWLQGFVQGVARD